MDNPMLGSDDQLPTRHPPITVLIDASSAVKGGGLTFARGTILAMSQMGLRMFVIAPQQLVAAIGHRCPEVSWIQPAASRAGRMFGTCFTASFMARRIGADAVLFLGNIGLSWTGVPAVVVSQLDLDAFRSRRGTRRNWVEVILLRWLMGWSYRRAVRVIAVSNSLAGKLHLWLGLPEERVVVVPEGVSAPETDRIGKRSGILAISGLQAHKGGWNLATALVDAQQRTGESVTVVGVTAEEAARAGWPAGEIHWLGSVSHEDLMQLYSTHRIFVYQSFAEAFGLPPLEAMSRGAAVVAPDIPAIRETCGSAAVFFDPGDPQAISDALYTVWRDPELHAPLLAAGRETAQRFSWSRTASEIVLVLGQVVRKQQP